MRRIVCSELPAFNKRSCSRSRFARLETDTAPPKPAVAAGRVRMSPSWGSVAGPIGIQRRRRGLSHFEDLPSMPRPTAADCKTLRLGLSHSEAVHERMRHYQSHEQARTSIPGRSRTTARRSLGNASSVPGCARRRIELPPSPPLGLAASAGVARTAGSIVEGQPERFRKKFDIHPDLGRSLLAPRLCGIIGVLGAWAPSPEGR